jgi:hypothetical protein
MKARYEAALTFDEFLAAAQQNKELWATMYRLARVPQSFVDRVRALPGRRYLLVLNEDWCGDAVNTVPAVAKLASLAPDQLELRVLGRDANPDLMDAHLTGTSRSIPVIILLDEDYVERGWWGPRPSELQAWVVRDRGLSTLEEIVAMMERAISYQLSAISKEDGGPAGR